MGLGPFGGATMMAPEGWPVKPAPKSAPPGVLLKPVEGGKLKLKVRFKQYQLLQVKVFFEFKLKPAAAVDKFKFNFNFK
jgi:hypothetical protein